MNSVCSTCSACQAFLPCPLCQFPCLSWHWTGFWWTNSTSHSLTGDGELFCGHTSAPFACLGCSIWLDFFLLSLSSINKACFKQRQKMPQLVINLQEKILIVADFDFLLLRANGKWKNFPRFFPFFFTVLILITPNHPNNLSGGYSYRMCALFFLRAKWNFLCEDVIFT